MDAFEKSLIIIVITSMLIALVLALNYASKGKKVNHPIASEQNISLIQNI